MNKRNNQIDYLNSQKNKFENRRDQSASQGNITERELAGQLILLTTVLITVNVVVLSNGALIETLTSPQKILILLAFLLECAATFLGIKHYQAVEEYFVTWADAEHSIVNLFVNEDFSTEDELAKKIQQAQEKLSNRSDQRMRRLQIWCIFFTFLVYFLLLIALFFDFRGILHFFT